MQDETTSNNEQVMKDIPIVEIDGNETTSNDQAVEIINTTETGRIQCAIPNEVQVPKEEIPKAILKPAPKPSYKYDEPHIEAMRTLRKVENLKNSLKERGVQKTDGLAVLVIGVEDALDEIVEFLNIRHKMGVKLDQLVEPNDLMALKKTFEEKKAEEEAKRQKDKEEREKRARGMRGGKTERERANGKANRHQQNKAAEREDNRFRSSNPGKAPEKKKK